MGNTKKVLLHFYPKDDENLNKLVQAKRREAEKAGTRMPTRSIVVRDLITQECEKLKV